MGTDAEEGSVGRDAGSRAWGDSSDLAAAAAASSQRARQNVKD